MAGLRSSVLSEVNMTCIVSSVADGEAPLQACRLSRGL